LFRFNTSDSLPVYLALRLTGLARELPDKCHLCKVARLIATDFELLIGDPAVGAYTILVPQDEHCTHLTPQFPVTYRVLQKSAASY